MSDVKSPGPLRDPLEFETTAASQYGGFSTLWGLGFRIQSLGFRIQSLGFRA